VDDPIIPQPGELAQEEARRTKAGEDRLDEIQTDEGGEQKPPRVDEMGEGDTEQGDGAGEEADEGFNFHGIGFDFT
jgi:hypothetical protein